MTARIEITRTGDSTYTGYAFTPDIDGVDQVEVVAEFGADAEEKAHRFAELLRDLVQDTFG